MLAGPNSLCILYSAIFRGAKFSQMRNLKQFTESIFTDMSLWLARLLYIPHAFAKFCGYRSICEKRELLSLKNLALYGNYTAKYQHLDLNQYVKVDIHVYTCTGTDVYMHDCTVHIMSLFLKSITPSMIAVTSPVTKVMTPTAISPTFQSVNVSVSVTGTVKVISYLT